MPIASVAAMIVLIVVGAISLAVLRSDRRSAWYLIGLGAFNGLLASINTHEAVSTFGYVLLLVSGGLLLDACSMAYERRHPVIGFTVALAAALTVAHVAAHTANPVTLITLFAEIAVTIVLGVHLFTRHRPSRIPEVYRQRETQ